MRTAETLLPVIKMRTTFQEASLLDHIDRLHKFSRTEQNYIGENDIMTINIVA